MQNYIHVGHSDFKDSPFWESQMLTNSVFTVTGKQLTNPRHALAQIDLLDCGDILLLHHNAGDATSGIKAITTVRTLATPAVPINTSVTPVEYIRTVEVDHWIILDEVLTHAEIEHHIGRLSSKIQRTVSRIEGDFATQLVNLFFSKLARQFNAKSAR